MAVSFGTMDWISGGVIAALVILNVSVGGYTEWQAEKVSHCLGIQGFIRSPKNMLTYLDCCFSGVCWSTSSYRCATIWRRTISHYFDNPC